MGAGLGLPVAGRRFGGLAGAVPALSVVGGGATPYGGVNSVVDTLQRFAAQASSAGATEWATKAQQLAQQLADAVNAVNDSQLVVAVTPTPQAAAATITDRLTAFLSSPLGLLTGAGLVFALARRG